MAGKRQKSPLTRLGKAIERKIANVAEADRALGSVRIPIRRLQEWRKWAEAPDARFRLDGSGLNKQKPADR